MPSACWDRLLWFWWGVHLLRKYIYKRFCFFKCKGYDTWETFKDNGHLTSLSLGKQKFKVVIFLVYPQLFRVFKMTINSYLCITAFFPQWPTDISKLPLCHCLMIYWLSSGVSSTVPANSQYEHLLYLSHNIILLTEYQSCASL